MSNTRVLDVSEQTFVQDVVERSREIPVVVDFWASWCGPCRTLGPLLERLADEANGSWVLAKVDVDANPSLASGFGIQGIPAVRAWKDGREVAEFVGALPEQQVRQWLGQLGPSAADVAFDEAKAALDRNDESAALQRLREVLELEPGHAEARAALERIELEQRVSTFDENDARRRVETNVADVEAASQLADVLAARGALEEAFDILVKTVGASTGDERDRARTHLLKLLDTLPAGDPRAMKARRALALVLF